MKTDVYDANSTRRPPLRVSDWLWRPLHAKLWWAAVLLYWVGMAVSGYVPPLDAFYDSAAAGFAMIFFFPPLIACVLCFGFFRECLAKQHYVTEEEDSQTPMSRSHYSPPIGPSGVPAALDPLDPRSGLLWNNNPANPNNPIGFNRVS
ncbi:hypothetical protein [Sphingobium sp.]|uniref:hypothetical protein n=1 Tax=Sphingobium TaxID=165695 RepID=UPI001A35445C|nr:hypothetical protein [Sphingobium sp.]MBJ7377092.1 hypothetical protein [Sphingobium sp.]